MTPRNSTPTVLLVDDDPEIRRLLRIILEKAGVSFVLADSGAQASVLFDKLHASLRLLVTDIVMPGMSGPNLAAHLLRQKPDLHILYISGYCDTVAGLSGVAAYIPKPFKPEELVAKIHELLACRRHET